MNAAGEWALAPAFDLTFSPGPGGEHYLAIDGEGRQPSRAHLLAEGAAAGLAPRRMGAIIDEVAEAVGQWAEIARNIGITAARSAEMATVFA